MRPLNLSLRVVVAFILASFVCTSTHAKGNGLQNHPACKKDPKGCAVVMPHDPVKIGTLYDITGPASDSGLLDNDAVLLALEENNTLGGHSFQRVSRSDGCDGSDTSPAIAGAKDLVANGVMGILGTTCSGAAKQAVENVTGSNGYLMFSASNTNPSLTDLGTHLPYYARAFNDNTQGSADASYVYNHLGFTQVAIVRDLSSVYSIGLAETFGTDFANLGGTITTVVDEDCSLSNCNDPQSHTSSLNKILAAGTPQLILILYVGAPDGAGFVTAARSLAALNNTVLMGGDALDDNTIVTGGDGFTGAGNAAEGFLASGPPANPQSFIDKYQKRFGTEPSAFSGIAYDEANLLLQVAKSVMVKMGDAKGDSILLFPRTALYNALIATHDYHGVMGPYDCSKDGQNSGDCLSDVVISISEVQNGSFVPVFP